MTQSLRALLAGQGVTVHAILTGPVDTDMTRSVDFPKASPESVAVGIFDGVEKGEEEIFSDPMSQSIAGGWRNGVARLSNASPQFSSRRTWRVLRSGARLTST
jgi:NAD(P)-dependent dehydrogenase (short-subunit alcohol dehydrogenase family)